MTYYSYTLTSGAWQTIAAANSKREAVENAEHQAQGRGYMISSGIRRAKEFLREYNARWESNFSRPTITRWCAEGRLPCDSVTNPASGKGVEYFILDTAIEIPPPKRGNPAIGKLRQRTLKRAARKSAETR